MENYVYVGFDRREADAYHACVDSIDHHRLKHPAKYQVLPLLLPELQADMTYTREIHRTGNQLFDVVSDHAMSTEFALSRFFVPLLVRRKRKLTDAPRWAIFCDSDMIFTNDLQRVFDLADPEKAVQVVQHSMAGDLGDIKMDGQAQSEYKRKNWSSFILWNVDHPAHDWLNLTRLNTTRGLLLHQFCWLTDKQIGELPSEWNFLVGYDQWFDDRPPANIHFTKGVPSMQDVEASDFDDYYWKHIYASAWK